MVWSCCRSQAVRALGSIGALRSVQVGDVPARSSLDLVLLLAGVHVNFSCLGTLLPGALQLGSLLLVDDGVGRVQRIVNAVLFNDAVQLAPLVLLVALPS